MSRLTQYREAERQLAEQLRLLEELKEDSQLKKEIEFEDKLRALMEEYEVKAHSVISILDPEAGRGRAKAEPATQGKRRPRTAKIYQHPNTGERIETKGGNHKVLKAWKAEHGADTVEGWLVGE